VFRHLGREHRSVQYAIGNPLIAKDVSGAAPEVALYTPLRIAVLESEEDGSTSILFDSAESLMGSFGSEKLHDKLAQRWTRSSSTQRNRRSGPRSSPPGMRSRIEVG
jgi:Domain of unknown function DUF302